MRWILILFLLVSGFVSADPGELTKVNREGIGALRKSLEAYGGEKSLQEAKLSITFNGDLINEGQSEIAEPTFETYPFHLRMKIDPSRKTTVLETTSSFAGDFGTNARAYVQNGEGFWIDLSGRTFSEMNSEPSYLDRYFPHKLILQALQNPASIRLQNSASGDKRIQYATARGQVQLFTLDGNSNLLKKVETINALGIYGDGIRETEYFDYRTFGSLPIPSRIVTRSISEVLGTVENTYRVSDVSREVKIEEAELAIPEGFTKADYSWRPGFNVLTLAKGIYLAQNITSETDQWSYNVLFVEFADFVLVAEAPVSSSTSETVIGKIKETIPGKPIRYLVQSHHHNDHLGGVRSYIAEGTTILTTPIAAPLIGKIAVAPFELTPDRLLRERKAPIVETVEGKRVVRDSTREAILYDIGPNPHAKHMLMIYLPQEKILYQSDMVNRAEYPVNKTTKSFLRKLAELNLQIEIMVGLHGKILQDDELKKFFAETSAD